MSHTLRALCDEIFGPENFRNEIAWKRTSAHSSANRYGPVHDSILYYSKGAEPVWNGPREDYEQAYLDKYYRYDDGDGRLYWRKSFTAAGTRRGSFRLPWRGIDVAATGQHWKFTRERLSADQAIHRVSMNSRPLAASTGPRAAAASCDILGWEWEMGLHDTITERARRRGLDVRPRQIPREVMERQVTEADAVRFFELAHVDLDVRRQGHEACVVLKDFAIPSEELIPPKGPRADRVVVRPLDYWSVDFDYSDEVFHNQWQAYRTKETPALLTQSDWHEYPEAGRYSIVVKIIDIFGNDTTKLAEVRIK